MTSAIDIYFQALVNVAGTVKGFGSKLSPVGSIEGAIMPSDDTVPITAGASGTLYSFVGGGQTFTLLSIVSDTDGEIWIGGGTPATGSQMPADLTWNMTPCKAGVPVNIAPATIRTNATAASHSADNAGDPLAWTDAGEEDGLIHRVKFRNTGATDALVRVLRA